MRRTKIFLLSLFIVGAVFSLSCRGDKTDPRLKHGFRLPEANGWTLVHLEGTPSEIGFQHGSLLAPEILEMQKINALELSRDHGKSWNIFRIAARDMMWPCIEPRYRQELQGITDGVNARGVNLDLWDIVALNGGLEWPYYLKTLDKKPKTGSPPGFVIPSHCSAFVATGSYTKDGRVVIAHNTWSPYLDGERWTIIFDIVPEQGYRILMDGLPGFIASDDDFGLNAAGLMITETTIDGFEGYDPAGIPEFIRARKAMQFASSIDDFARIMKDGNNGGYANDWLVADRKTGEIASFELGLKNVTLERKTDGYFVGANFPISPKLALEETTFDAKDLSSSPNARHARWEQLMADNKGKIDVALAQRFLADHYDSYQKKNEPNERTLCGHVDLSPRGWLPWPPYGPYGAVQNKVADSASAEQLSFWAAAGHACGLDFKAADHLKAYPEFVWQKEFLRDMPSRPWTKVGISK
jgi:hypothetical protein